jgi:hypothetical protein
MPKGSDWGNFIYINIAFLAQIIALYIFIYINEIKKDWPKYRCNPMFMPLSDNMQQDFTYCVQTMQTDFMGYLLEPLTFIISNLTTMGSDMTDTLNFFRVMLSNIRTFMSSITEMIMGVFLNLIIEFQKIVIGIRDMIGKMAGIMATLLYIMDGSIKTMQSAWNGPPGQMVRFIGNCFHPDTVVRLQSGKIVKMENLSLGDYLENGSKVCILMKINKEPTDVLYKISGGADGRNVYVTGTHMILNEKTRKYVMVQDHPEARTQTKKDCDHFTCIITDDHKIQIGKRTFYDWDDDDIRRESYPNSTFKKA